MCSPPARNPSRFWLSRRSTTPTSTRASASSPANISPVGPPPAITTACPLIATPQSALRPSRNAFRPLISLSLLVSVHNHAARLGSCRKPPGGLYTSSGRERGFSFFSRPLCTDKLFCVAVGYGGSVFLFETARGRLAAHFVGSFTATTLSPSTSFICCTIPDGQ